MIVDISVWNCSIMALRPEIPTPMPNNDVGKHIFFHSVESERLNKRQTFLNQKTLRFTLFFNPSLTYQFTQPHYHFSDVIGWVKVRAIPGLRMRDLEPNDDYGVYKITVYPFSKKSRYTNWCTPEARKTIEEYIALRKRWGERITDESPVLELIITFTRQLRQNP